MSFSALRVKRYISANNKTLLTLELYWLTWYKGRLVLLCCLLAAGDMVLFRGRGDHWPIPSNFPTDVSQYSLYTPSKRSIQVMTSSSRLWTMSLYAKYLDMNSNMTCAHEYNGIINENKHDKSELLHVQHVQCH